MPSLLDVYHSACMCQELVGREFSKAGFKNRFLD
jgi:hypothetical protein